MIANIKHIIFPILWMGFLVALFIITYILNRKVSKPEDCDELINAAMCKGCKQISCSHRKE